MNIATNTEKLAKDPEVSEEAVKSRRLYASFYDALKTIPLVADASFQDNNSVAVTLKQSDLTSDVSRTYTSTFVKTSDQFSRATVFPTSADGVQSFHSPSRRYSVTVRKAPAGAEEAKTPAYLLEVWDAVQLQCVCSVNTKGKHGDLFLKKDVLGGVGIDWSRDETTLVYLAEAKAKKQKTFWDEEDTDSKADSKADKGTAEVVPGLKYNHKQHFGEEMSDVLEPCIFVLDIRARSITKVEGIPSSVIPGQVVMSGDSKGVIFTGYSDTPRKLGMRHYNTRSSRLYFQPFSKPGDGTHSSPEVLTPDDHSAMCARVSATGDVLYVTTDDVGLHCSCSRLRLLKWGTRKISTVIDVARPRSMHEFPGLWPASGGMGLLPTRLWLDDSRHAVISTQWRAQETLIVVDTERGTIRRLHPPAELKSMSVSLLDVKANSILVRISGISQPDAVYYLDLTPVIEGDFDDAPSSKYSHVTCSNLDWTLVARCMPATDTLTPSDKSSVRDAMISKLKEIHWDLIPVQQPSVPKSQAGDATLSGGRDDQKSDVDEEKSVPFDCILVLPNAPKSDEKSDDSAASSTADKPRLIVYPHGGPHAADSTHFNTIACFFATLGHATLLINYRGSTGYGQPLLESLPGKVGEMDVEDCLLALDKVLSLGVVDKNKLSVFGGSHGGFLTTHLIGQRPDLFSAAAARNPVTNIAHMAASTDITDWCYAECGISFSETYVPTAEDYSRMFNMSPIKYVSAVRTPLLIMVGDADRRVPMSQSIDYHRTLTALGVRTRMLLYPGNQHGLADSIGTNADSVVNSALWLAGYFF